MYLQHQLDWRDKAQCYGQLYTQLQGILHEEHYVTANLSNAAALLYHSMTEINWVGFYLWHDGQLSLGPFQGNVACMHIASGKGVCGTAVASGSTQLVTDVHQFSGHIACDSASQAEIVIPIYFNGVIVGVLDIDSPVLKRFDQQDQRGLERIVRLLEDSCRWEAFRYC